MVAMKRNTHTVIKNADIDKYLAINDANTLKALIERLRVSKACNSRNHKEYSYYVVNTDEPYASKVLDVILEGEKNKEVCEKQTPKKVDRVGNKCPVCKCYLASEPIGDKYCFNCGQAIDWSV